MKAEIKINTMIGDWVKLEIWRASDKKTLHSGQRPRRGIKYSGQCCNQFVQSGIMRLLVSQYLTAANLRGPSCKSKKDSMARARSLAGSGRKHNQRQRMKTK